MLTVSHLRKEFNSVVAVDDVSFQIQRGEIFGLIGPNGAGKSTTIRVALNILEQTSGQVLFDGQPFGENTRNIVGYLPEERGLYKKSKVLDTILYFAELRGMHRSHAHTEAGKWLKRFGLSLHLHRRIDELSKGNQQKVQFIAAIIHDPQLVVLDEPFSGLDPVNQILFKDIFLEMKQRGKAILYSTHQMDYAEKLSDHLCMINKGGVVLTGTVRSVKRQYGANTIHVEFHGNGAFLESLPGVHRVILFQNSAEVELDPGVSTQAILPAMVQNVELQKFEVHEPSLQSIFIQIVGTDNQEVPEQVGIS